MSSLLRVGARLKNKCHLKKKWDQSRQDFTKTHKEKKINDDFMNRKMVLSSLSNLFKPVSSPFQYLSVSFFFLEQKSRRCSCSSPGNPVASSSKGLLPPKKNLKNLSEWVNRAGRSRAARSSRWRGNKQVRLPWTEQSPSKTNIPGGPLGEGGALSGPRPAAAGSDSASHWAGGAAQSG